MTAIAEPPLRKLAAEAESPAADILCDQRHECTTPRGTDLIATYEVATLGIAATDALVMLGLGWADLRPSINLVTSYIERAWNYDLGTLNAIRERCAGVAVPPRTGDRPSPIELRDCVDQVLGPWISAGDALAALAPESDLRLLEATRKRLDCYHARSASEAELRRVLDIVDELLATRVPRGAPRTLFWKESLQEGRRQRDAGVPHRTVDDVRRDLGARRPTP